VFLFSSCCQWRVVGGLKLGERRAGVKVLLSPHMGYVKEELVGKFYDDQAEIVERWHRGEDLLNILT
jgi:hypothetical protein